MEKRILHFFVITILFIVGYTQFINKYYPQQPQKPQEPTTSSQEITQHIAQEELTDFSSNSIPEGEIAEAEMEKYIVTVSLTGGYISKLYSKEYNETLDIRYLGLIPTYSDKLFTLSSSDNSITLENKDAGVKKTWTFDGYAIRYDTVLPRLSGSMVLFSNALSNNGFEQRYQEFFYADASSPVLKRIPLRKIKTTQKQLLTMVGTRDRHYCLASLDNIFPTFDLKRVDISKKEKVVYFSVPLHKKQSSYSFYLGPQLYNNLEKYGLESVIYYGFFHGLGVLLIKILSFFYTIFHNWGISIILLSICINVALFPVTAKSTKAMKKMQEINPLLEELRNKYKDNPQKMQKAQIELFKKHHINPLGSCLPMFLQIPVFIALYQVFWRVVEFKGAHFLWIQDLSVPDHLFKLPFNQPLDYFNLLPILVAAIMFVQQKITTANAQAQQRQMGLFFTVFIGVIFYQFPSCLVLYWFVQNIITVIYQYRVHSLKPAEEA